MDSFPALSTWFFVRENVANPHRYTRYDLCLKPGAEIDDLAQHLAGLISRLRLNPGELVVWDKFCKTDIPFPDEWAGRFRDRFWRGFVSTTATEGAGGKIQPDETALQGYIGELILHIIANQLHCYRIDSVPRKPKIYSKDSGIDYLEVCGDKDVPLSLYYIVWESKGITSDTIGNYPRKIYNQLLFDTPKTFGEAVDQLADLHQEDPILADFINHMIDDFYVRPPTSKKCFGGSVSYSGSQFPGNHVFNQFAHEFRGVESHNVIPR